MKTNIHVIHFGLQVPDDNEDFLVFDHALTTEKIIRNKPLKMAL